MSHYDRKKSVNNQRSLPVLPAIVRLSPFHNVDFMCGVRTSHVVKIPKHRYETATQFLPARKTLPYLNSMTKTLPDKTGFFPLSCCKTDFMMEFYLVLLVLKSSGNCLRGDSPRISQDDDFQQHFLPGCHSSTAAGRQTAESSALTGSPTMLF